MVFFTNKKISLTDSIDLAQIHKIFKRDTLKTATICWLYLVQIANKTSMTSEVLKSYAINCAVTRKSHHKDAASGGFNEKNLQVPAQ